MATDSVGWLTKQASAARPKCRSRATATMYLSSVRVMAIRTLRGTAAGSGMMERGSCAQEVFAAAHPARQMGLDRRRMLRAEEHTSELQSRMRPTYATFCLKKK